jgi:hypothetical protein
VNVVSNFFFSADSREELSFFVDDLEVITVQLLLVRGSILKTVDHLRRRQYVSA